MPLSDILYLGANLTATLTENVKATYNVDKSGVIKATLGYHCRWDVQHLLIARVTAHPDFPFLKKVDSSAERTEGYIAEVTINFEGISPEQSGDGSAGENGEITTFTVEATLDTEPIETHPTFKEWGGEWNDEATWPDGSLGFDPQGQFKGFASTLEDGSPNPKGGVRSYLSPGVTYVRTRTIPAVVSSAVGVSLRNVGYITDVPASRILPAVSSGRTWLQMGTTVEQIGDGIRITERWKLSGRNGWDTDIYSTSD